MEQSRFFQGTVYRFSEVAVQEITNRFDARIPHPHAKIWYKSEHALFELRCPTSIGSAANEALGDVLRAFIEHDLPQAAQHGHPPLAHMSVAFYEGGPEELQNAGEGVNLVLPQQPQPSLKPLPPHHLPRFVIAGDLVKDSPEPKGHIQTSPSTCLDMIKLQNLPSTILARVLTSNKSSDYRRMRIGALLCHTQIDHQGNSTISVGKIQKPNPGAVALQMMNTMASFPRLTGHGVSANELLALSQVDKDPVPVGAMAQWFSNLNASDDMGDPKQSAAAPSDALQFQLAPNVVQGDTRRRVAKFNIDAAPALVDESDADDEDDDQPYLDRAATFESFQKIFGKSDLAGVSLPTMPGASRENATSAVLTPATSSALKSSIVDDASLTVAGLDTSSALGSLNSGHDPKFGTVNKRGLLAGDAKAQALWNLQNYSSSDIAASALDRPNMFLRGRHNPSSLITQSQRHGLLVPIEPDAESNNGTLPPAWERKIAPLLVEQGKLIDDSEEPSQVTNNGSRAQVPVPPGFYPFLKTLAQERADEVVEKLQPEAAIERKFNTMGQQAGGRKGKGKAATRSAPAVRPPSKPAKLGYEVGTSSGEASGAAYTATAPKPESSDVSAMEESTEPLTVEQAMATPASLKTLTPFLRAILHQYARVEIQFGLAPLIYKSKGTEISGEERSPGWWQRMLNEHAQSLQSVFTPRLTTSEDDAAWLLSLSQTDNIYADAVYHIRTRSSLTGKLENHLVHPPSDDGEPIRIQTFEENTVAYLHYPLMLWDAMISAATGHEGSQDIANLVASMQSYGDAPAFVAKVPDTFLEVPLIHARREFEKPTLLAGGYLVITEVQELEIVPVKSQHFDIAAKCSSRGQMIEEQRLWYEVKLVLENVSTSNASAVEFTVHQLASRIDVVGLGNVGPWRTMGETSEVEEPMEATPSMW